MSKNKAHIEAMASHEAPQVILTSWIEDQIRETMQRLRIPKGYIKRLTGVSERRYWNNGEKMHELATEAVRNAIEKAGIDPQEVGCLINTSVCRDHLEPSQACMVHGALGLSNDCLTYDITNACLGFVNGMDAVRHMIEAGSIKYGVVVTAEGSMKALTNVLGILKKSNCDSKTFMQYLAMLTIGSGAVAMVLSHEDVAKSDAYINATVSMTDTANGNNRLCFASCDHSQMIADAIGILANGLPLVAKTWEKAKRLIPGWGDDNIDLYIPHQTSSRQIREVSKHLGLTKENVHVVLGRLGNAISAAVPLTLHDAIETNRIKAGDHVALMGVGSGLNCMIMSTKW